MMEDNANDRISGVIQTFERLFVSLIVPTKLVV